MGEADEAKWSLEMHKKYAGKIEIMPRVPIRGIDDFSLWYTPGVADVVLAVSKDPDLSFEYTSRWNVVAVVSDGTRVLGLGDVGPEAAYAVMEGKALLFKYLGGIDAVPIVHKSRDPRDFVALLKTLEPSFGGVNLEDVESPKCFAILEEAREALSIPVWHDDQQGTAAASLAGLINAFHVVGKDLRRSRILLYGAGAANIALYNLLKKYGVSPRNIIVVDSKGVIHPERDDIDRFMFTHPWKFRIAVETLGGGLQDPSDVARAFEDVDAIVAASRPGPGIIKPSWIRMASKDVILFALANPTPEIWPDEAKRAGARIVATGRSDFPNQVNNSLIFPGLFRGVLDARATKITDSMVIAASEELARYAREKGVSEDYILPAINEWEFHPRVAAAVASKAVEEGVARRRLTYRDELSIASNIIGSARRKIEALMRAGLVKPSRLGGGGA